jgi:cytochrome c5
MKQATQIMAISVLFALSALAYRAGPLPDDSLDGASLYRTNCTRCHSIVKTYSPRRMKTVTQHMRVRANLPPDAVHAVLDYLNGESEEKHEKK